jgi:hypothetical protein
LLLKRDNFERLVSPHKNIFFTAISVCILRYWEYGWRKAAAQSSVVATMWGNNKPMQEYREQGRDSTRRREGSGFDGRRLRVVDTPISLSTELACYPPARDIAGANRQRSDISLSGQYLKLSRRAMIAILTVIGVVPLNNHGSNAQMASQDKPPIAYFLDRVPESLDSSTLPKTARDVVVARVRITSSPSYLGGRDQSGIRSPRPPYLFHARMKILNVRSGSASVGAEVDATFGEPFPLIHFPHTPNQLSRDYDVVIYSGDDDERHLAGFMISETQYREWDEEVRSYERTRNAPPKPR